MKVLRTPDERFSDLPDYPFSPHYVDVATDELEPIRMHYVDEGPKQGAAVLLLHGEPSWSYLYRKMIPPLTAAGYRVLAPDLIGFGKSDKPAADSDHTYARHVGWIADWLLQLGISKITLFCQDWGSLIGLRLVAEHSDRFARVVVGNGGLPTGDEKLPEAFFAWRKFSQEIPEFPVGGIINGATTTELGADVMAAYDAPFVDESYKAGARALPALVPASPDDPAAGANRSAWRVLSTWTRPFLTTFSDQDPITRGGHRVFQELIPGAKGQPHVTIKGAGHFLQEDQGEQIAEVLLDFIRATP